MNTSQNSGGNRGIRPGQRRPYHKGTRQQITARIGFVAQLMQARNTKTQIHRAVRERFNVEWRQCDRYMAHACARAFGLKKLPASPISKRFSDSAT